MKKMNQNFKILTKEEVSQVKGGGWLSTMLTSMYNRYQASRAEATMTATGGAECPPPEPDSE